MTDGYRGILRDKIRPRFDRHSDRRADAVLIQHSGEITARDAEQSAPEIAGNPPNFGGLFGELNGTPEASLWRSYYITGADRETADNLLSIATAAGRCIGPWASGVLAPETIAEPEPELRWFHALFDLAAGNHPGFLLRPTLSRIKEADITRLKMEASLAADPDTAKLLAEAKRLASLGYVVKLRDVFRASVDAIDVLAEGEAPAVDVSNPGSKEVGHDYLTTNKTLRDDRDDALLERFRPGDKEHPTYKELAQWLEAEAGRNDWATVEASSIRDCLVRAWQRKTGDKWPFDRRGKGNKEIRK